MGSVCGRRTNMQRAPGVGLVEWVEVAGVAQVKDEVKSCNVNFLKVL